MVFVVSEKEGMHGTLLIITDKELIGRKYEENNLQLDLSKDFYKGKEKSESTVKEMLIRAKHLHLTGKSIVALAIDLGLVDPKKILYVEGIPHAEMVVG